MGFFRHMVHQMVTTWRLIFRSPEALMQLDRSETAFWRSFWAFVPSTLFLQLLLLGYFNDGAMPRWTTLTALTAAAALPWMLWPLLAFYLLKTLKLQQRYFGYIIVNNWTALIPVPFTLLLLAAIPALKTQGGALFLLACCYLVLLTGIWWRATQRSLCDTPVMAGRVLVVQIGVTIGCAMVQQMAITFGGIGR